MHWRRRAGLGARPRGWSRAPGAPQARWRRVLVDGVEARAGAHLGCGPSPPAAPSNACSLSTVAQFLVVTVLPNLPSKASAARLPRMPPGSAGRRHGGRPRIVPRCGECRDGCEFLQRGAVLRERDQQPRVLRRGRLERTRRDDRRPVRLRHHDDRNVEIEPVRDGGPDVRRVLRRRAPVGAEHRVAAVEQRRDAGEAQARAVRGARPSAGAWPCRR